MKYNKGMILAMGRNGATMATLDIISKVAKQARLYQKMAEYSCNGEGILHGRKITTAIGTEAHPADKFYTDKGYSTAYANIEMTVTEFDKESIKARKKIEDVIKDNTDFKAKFQGDPRGVCVRLRWKDVDVTELLY